MSLDFYLDCIPLMALDTLPDEQRTETEIHVYRCDECLAELDHYLEVVASLVPDQPPPLGVWQKIVDATDGSESRRRRLSVVADTRILTWLVAAAIGAVLALGGVVVSSGDESPSQRIVVAAETASQEPSAIVADLISDETGQEVARVILTGDGQGYLLPSETLQDLSSGRTYQLWVITPDEMAISAGVLGASPEPATFTWAGEVSGFALTREVEGGVVSSEGDVVSIVSGL